MPDVDVQHYWDVQHPERVGDCLVLGHVLLVGCRRAPDQHGVRVLEPARVPQPVQQPGESYAQLAGLEVDQQTLVGCSRPYAGTSAYGVPASGERPRGSHRSAARASTSPPPSTDQAPPVQGHRPRPRGRSA